MKQPCIIVLVLLLGGLVRPLWAQEDPSPQNVLDVDRAPFGLKAGPPPSSEDVVDIAVRLPKDGVQAGAAFEAFVLVQVAPGWHVNANEPLQSYFIGTALKVEEHAALRLNAAYYPDPLFRSFGFTADTLAVYEGEVAIILALQAANTLRPGVHTMASQLRVQACSDEVCLRPSTVSVPIPVEIVE